MRVSSLPKLNIGAGRSPLPKEEGWINCDLYHGEGVDLAFDCQGPWPFENESVMEVRSDHTVEHLSDPMAFFREAWRVLIPNGQLNLRLPYGWHQSSWWDLTHLRPWLQESFATVQPGFTQFTRNHQHDHLSCAFWVNNVIMILEKSWARMFRFWPLRPIVKWGARHLLNVIKDLRVEAFKTTLDDSRSTAYGGHIHPAIVPCSWGVLEHEYYGRSVKGLQVHTLLVICEGYAATAGREE